jgi:diketogulonate reductase-like aldo/keto reductase
MRSHRFGAAGDFVPVIGQGTWCIEGDDRATAVAALRAGFDLGMTHVDTAEMYGSGKAEEIVAEAMTGRRDHVFLVSKVLPDNASRNGTVLACEASLRRLKTDRLDCYLLHWPGSHPLADTIDAFERLRSSGKILSWGVSNFDVAELDEALVIAGPGQIACNQVLYHLEERAIEHGVVPWCEKNGVAVVGYSPFGHGRFPAPNTKKGKALADIAKTHNATIRQVALSFLVRRPSLFAIPKAAKPAHMRENGGAGTLKLSEIEIAALDAAFPKGKPRGLPML